MGQSITIVVVRSFRTDRVTTYLRTDALHRRPPAPGVPRTTGWGTDPNRKLVFRRVDGYLTAKRIPIRLHGRSDSRTVSYHRPLQEYVAALARSAFRVEALVERTMSDEQHRRIAIRGPSRHNADIPVLLGIRASR